MYKPIDIPWANYWSSIWQSDPAVRQQLGFIASLITGLRRTRDVVNVLEVGRANSFWLPCIAKQLGARVFATDAV